MKQKIYILGLLTVLIVIAGLVFKVNHLAGAGILLTSWFYHPCYCFFTSSFERSLQI